MKSFPVRVFLISAAIAFLSENNLLAQDVVFNGDFETGILSPSWILFGGNKHTQITLFETVQGQESLCLKRRPGPPDGDGGIECGVHLQEGVLYFFSARIAAYFCSI